ncbi:hypothetical protein FKW77_010596 [Venturia effusa]|uniref:Uncharacterized protein n=1 Tax=Venturia effusa TaxID=50376 RepID=A0A517KXX5_9PEZI|nr:hypothetical protein FKW77_010596 [Venturia effusa]
MSSGRLPRPATGPRPINDYFRVTKPASRNQPTFNTTKTSQLSFRPATLNLRHAEAVDLTAVGPNQPNLEVYRPLARGHLSLPRPRPVHSVPEREFRSFRAVPEVTPKFLALCINFNVPTPPEHYRYRYLDAPARIPIQLHTGDPKSCLDFLTVHGQALPRIVALVLRIRHTQDPAQWIALLKLFVQGARNLQYLDVFFAPPAERGSFPRCGPNPWCENEAFLAVCGNLAVNINTKALGKLKVGGMFTDSFASYMKLRLSGNKLSFYMPPGWEKPRPIVFFTSAEDCENNAGIVTLWKGFVWKVDVAEPSGLFQFLEKNPSFGDRIGELNVRIYDEEGVQAWTELFSRLGKEAGMLENASIYWDQLSRETRGKDVNVLSVDEGMSESLASIRVKYSLTLVGLYAPLLVSILEERTGMVGQKMMNGNHVLTHQLPPHNDYYGSQRKGS